MKFVGAPDCAQGVVAERSQGVSASAQEALLNVANAVVRVSDRACERAVENGVHRKVARARVPGLTH